MWFGELPLSEAEGTILAHSVLSKSDSEGPARFRKGLVLKSSDIDALRFAGVERVTVARLDPEDVGEDLAATRLAEALVPDPSAVGLTVTQAFTGRVNFHAVGPGIVDLNVDAIQALNRVDPSITLATLSPNVRVSSGTLVGTVKIISYAVPEAALDVACDHAQKAVRVLPVVLKTAGLILTEVPGLPEKLQDKGRQAIESRLAALGMSLAEHCVIPHDERAIAEKLGEVKGDMVLILTGSATSDLYDTAPQAVRRSGGNVARFGMPVDPGNLLFHGSLGTRPVVGLPGCARSPALNGAYCIL